MPQATTLGTLETLVRYILNDAVKSMIPGDIFTYQNSAIFTLTEPNALAVTHVYQNGAELATNKYSYDSTANKLTVTASMTSGDVIEIQYTYYPNYSSTEIQGYVQAALVHLSTNNYYTWQVAGNTLYPDPEPNEANLIALVTATLVYPDNKSYSLPDIRITVPKDLPLYLKIQKIIAIARRNTHGAFELL